MKKLILITAAALSFSACGINYKLSKACNVSILLQASTGGKVTACVTCDSITPRLLKKLVRKYGDKTQTHHDFEDRRFIR